jgi:hypothetical protein
LGQTRKRQKQSTYKIRIGRKAQAGVSKMARKPKVEVVDSEEQQPTKTKGKREPVTIEHEVGNGNGGSKSRAVVKRSSTAIGAPLDWRKEMAQYAAKTIKQEENVAAGNRISFKGGVISYKGTPLQGNELHCIIVAGLIENAYYPGKYNPDSPTAPVCFAFSVDGEDMAPHDKSHDPQHETCKGCPHDEWGSADTGRGKACKNVRRIAVLPLKWPFKEADVMDVELATASIPVTSVKAYSGYVKNLAQGGLAPWAWQTRIYCQPDPKTQFRVGFESSRQPIPEGLRNAILARVKEAERVIDEPYVYVDPSTIERPSATKARGGKNAPAAARRAKY